ncbi:hypothetical protein [Yersinia intermedia]|uniref:hypothetical protein n=1 Tax=Yersinia intermedia TaxID=631 RepID=UPI0030D37731
MNNNYNTKSIIVTIVNVGISALFSFCLTQSLTNNSDALNLVANVFSILTGFLLLVITMSSDNASILDKLTDTQKAHQETRFDMRFNKYYLLFLIYLTVLGLIFIHYLISKDTKNTSASFLFIKSSIAYLITFLTSLSFIQSLFIPLKIKELFKEKRALTSEEKKY